MDINKSTTIDRKTEYRDLLDGIENLNDSESINSDPTFINETLQRANILFKGANLKEKVKHTDEVLLDAKVVATASDALLKVTNQIDCSLDTYDPMDFARRIRSKLIDTDVDEHSDAYYANLIAATQNIYGKVPQFYSFFGPIGKPSAESAPAIPKERKTQKKKTRVEQAPTKAPERITHAEKEEDSVDDTVKFLLWSLTKEYEENNSKPISYYHFLIDPNSFSTSIENMFHMSFLVRDGRVKMESDKSENIFISPLSSQELKRTKKGLVKNTQYMFSIDMKKWNEVINDKRIKKYFLEKRKKEWEEIKHNS